MLPTVIVVDNTTMSLWKLLIWNFSISTHLYKSKCSSSSNAPIYFFSQNSWETTKHSSCFFILSLHLQTNFLPAHPPTKQNPRSQQWKAKTASANLLYMPSSFLKTFMHFHYLSEILFLCLFVVFEIYYHSFTRTSFNFFPCLCVLVLLSTFNLLI